MQKRKNRKLMKSGINLKNLDKMINLLRKRSHYLQNHQANQSKIKLNSKWNIAGKLNRKMGTNQDPYSFQLHLRKDVRQYNSLQRFTNWPILTTWRRNASMKSIINGISGKSIFNLRGEKMTGKSLRHISRSTMKCWGSCMTTLARINGLTTAQMSRGSHIHPPTIT